MEKQDNLKIDNINNLPINDILKINSFLNNKKELSSKEKEFALSSYKIERSISKLFIEKNKIKDDLINKNIMSIKEFELFETEKLSKNFSFNQISENISKIKEYIFEIRKEDILKLTEFKSEIIVDDYLNKNYKHLSALFKALIIEGIALEEFKKTEQFKMSITERILVDNNVCFLYFNTTPVEEIKTVKDKYIVDSNGENLLISKAYQSNEDFSRVLFLNYKTLRIKVPIYFGLIMTGEK